MKKLHLTTLFVVLLCMVSISLYAQQTTMTIDNQTPGWLSSKINYGDQQTVENLKVTGYLNGTDFKFLIDLRNNQKLMVLDLADANIVHGGETLVYVDGYRNVKIEFEDNILSSYLFVYFFQRLQKFITPKTLMGENYLIFNCDSVIINGIFKRLTLSLNNRINYLELAEGIDSLAFEGNNYYKHKMILPSTIKKLANLRLTNGDKRIIVSKIEHPELVEYSNCIIEDGDTILVPRGTKERYQSKKSPFSVFKNIVELVPPESIVLNKLSMKLFKNEKFTLSASLIPTDAYYKGIIWKSTDENVVTVSQTGEVIATGYGTASVIVCSEKDENTADTCIVNVYEHTTGVNISQSNTEVNVGETIGLSAYTIPQGTTDNELVWRSSNEEVATVNSNGKVTALKVGVCTISATAIDGGSTAECVVTVIQPANSINMNKHYLSIRVGSYEELQATVSPDNTTYKEVKWASSNKDVAEVSERGIVTAKKAGKAYISAHSISNSNVKDSCEVVVLQPVTGIKMDEASITFEGIGKTTQLTATVLPDDASDKALRWSSSNTSVCTVSDGGFIVAVGIGVSVVTATTVDGGFVAVCIVTVKETDGIVSIDIDSLNGNERIYDAQGKRITNLQRGINIIRMNDGTIRKVVVK